MTTLSQLVNEATRTHGCASIGRDGEDWWYVTCDCGKTFGGMPDPTTAVDELLDHTLAALHARLSGTQETGQ